MPDGDILPMREDSTVIAGMANPNYKGDPPYTGAWKGCAYDPELPGPIFHTGAQPRTPASPPRARSGRAASHLVDAGASHSGTASARCAPPSRAALDSARFRRLRIRLSRFVRPFGGR